MIKQGLSYPPAYDGNGSLKLSKDEDLVADAIYSVLDTRPGERVIRQKYGTPSFVLESVSSLGIHTGRIEASLSDQVSDPDSFSVDGDYFEEGIVDIEIRYRLSQLEQPPLRLRINGNPS
jgi:hypothetical protein